jgi:uncharacterized SAM-binding protein YcdF (DUF218 family)
MARLLSTLSRLGLLGALAGAGGFALFADSVRRLEPASEVAADAIVVLTGDEDRISTGMRLMEAGRYRRLLISGVHPTTRLPTELKRHVRGKETLLRCCVDLGHEAQNTSGNAEEANRWAEGHGFSSLIVVTSSYHLPRSLTEFQRVMPHVRLVGYPASPGRNLRLEHWWRHPPTLRLLAGEYVKLLGATLRLAGERLITAARPAPASAPRQGPQGDESRTIGAVR